MTALFAVCFVLAAVPLLILWYAIVFPRQPVTGPLPPIDDEGAALSERLSQHLIAIASRPHNLDCPEDLEAAAGIIEQTLRDMGYEPGAQAYDVHGHRVRNIEIEIAAPPAGPATPIIVLGAHYDSPQGSPGANDNGSGVAAVLEIARALDGFVPSQHRLRLVFWVNEEAPWGKTPAMGSWQHAKRLKESGEPVAGVIALETLGHFTRKPGSQVFPFPFGLIYPDRGDFVAFVGLPGSRAFLRRLIKSFRRHAAFPSIGGVAPGFLEGIDLSDHWSYHQFAMPALMVTDTAPFRNPFYHTPHDLPETVDTGSLARITQGLIAALREIA